MATREPLGVRFGCLTTDRDLRRLPCPRILPRRPYPLPRPRSRWRPVLAASLIRGSSPARAGRECQKTGPDERNGQDSRRPTVGPAQDNCPSLQGLSKTRTTLNIYTRVLDEAKRQAADVMGDLFGGLPSAAGSQLPIRDAHTGGDPDQ